eukprot:2478584-Pleurochrysis_carterae.AAC.1
MGGRMCGRGNDSTPTSAARRAAEFIGLRKRTTSRTAESAFGESDGADWAVGEDERSDAASRRQMLERVRARAAEQ